MWSIVIGIYDVLVSFINRPSILREELRIFVEFLKWFLVTVNCSLILNSEWVSHEDVLELRLLFCLNFISFVIKDQHVSWRSMRNLFLKKRVLHLLWSFVWNMCNLKLSFYWGCNFFKLEITNNGCIFVLRRSNFLFLVSSFVTNFITLIIRYFCFWLERSHLLNWVILLWLEILLGSCKWFACVTGWLSFLDVSCIFSELCFYLLSVSRSILLSIYLGYSLCYSFFV